MIVFSFARLFQKSWIIKTSFCSCCRCCYVIINTANFLYTYSWNRISGCNLGQQVGTELQHTMLSATENHNNFINTTNLMYAYLWNRKTGMRGKSWQGKITGRLSQHGVCIFPHVLHFLLTRPTTIMIKKGLFVQAERCRCSFIFTAGFATYPFVPDKRLIGIVQWAHAGLLSQNAVVSAKYPSTAQLSV